MVDLIKYSLIDKRQKLVLFLEKPPWNVNKLRRERDEEQQQQQQQWGRGEGERGKEKGEREEREGGEETGITGSEGYSMFNFLRN